MVENEARTDVACLVGRDRTWLWSWKGKRGIVVLTKRTAGVYAFVCVSLVLCVYQCMYVIVFTVREEYLPSLGTALYMYVFMYVCMYVCIFSVFLFMCVQLFWRREELFWLPSEHVLAEWTTHHIAHVCMCSKRERQMFCIFIFYLYLYICIHLCICVYAHIHMHTHTQMLDMFK
jgi:hypothetical protein